MKKITIKDAIVIVLKNEKLPLSPKDIYKKIVGTQLYEFKAKSPISVVNSEIRKNCYGINLKKANTIKIFERIGDDKFKLRS